MRGLYSSKDAPIVAPGARGIDGHTTFSAERVYAILQTEVFKGNQATPPLETCAVLAKQLNQLGGICSFASRIAGPWKKRGQEVRDAIDTLRDFFDEREKSWSRTYPPEHPVVSEEQKLRKKLNRFLKALDCHTFLLEIDVGQLLGDTEEEWHAIALDLRRVFREFCPLPSNGTAKGAGIEHRFVAAMSGAIVGTAPSAVSVRKYFERHLSRSSPVGK